jgi:hypothetical protein
VTPTTDLVVFANAFDNAPKPRSYTWTELCSRLTTFRVYPGVGDDKKLRSGRVPCWSPATYPEGKTRAAEHVDEVTMLVLDYDDGTPIEVALERWRDWPLAWYTSWNHTREKHRFRVVIPLARRIPAQLWLRVWTWAANRSAGKIDPACKDPSRVYFIPAIRSEDWPHASGVVDEGGELLDLDALTLPDPTPPKKPLPPPRRFPAGTPHWKVQREIRERLKVDPQARERLASELGARVRGAGRSYRATEVRCPKCGDASVWWPIEPESSVKAMCNHRNSCGWTGFLDELAGAVA